MRNITSHTGPEDEKPSGLVSQTFYVLAAIFLGVLVIIAAGIALFFASKLFGAVAFLLILFGLPFIGIFLVFLQDTSSQS